MTKGKSYYFVAVLAVAGLALLGARARADGDGFYADLTRLDKVVTKITESYVEEIPSRELVDAAIAGMREVLDPHTAYFDARDYGELKVSTEGEFGGLGIQIGIRDNILTVVSPLAGTPAHRMGLRAGDKITRIDTLDTRGITVDDAVSRLRGKPGSKVTLRIRREGVADPLDYTITREVIKIESVPFADLLDDSTGYVKVTQFSRTTAEDLEKKLRDLQARGARALVLDLRTNPGGLLGQSVEVSELFLGKGRTVVQTKGRVRSQNQDYRSGRDPLWKGKLVVLVNGSSASAAEIVAGAVQDWDRGLLLGTPTFGKGSVQTVLPLDNRDNALKLTTAYYYTPSGRCINKPENGRKGRSRPDDEDGADTATAGASDTAVFHTKAGRPVKAAGGITPDVVVSDRRYSRFVLELFRRNMFFDFAVKHRAEIASKAPITAAFEASPALLAEFRAQVFADTAFSRFRGASAAALEDSRAAWRRERADRGDTASATAAFDAAYASLDALLRAEGAREFDAARELIRRELEAEILGAALGEEARTARELRHDAQVLEARKLLADGRAYAASLKAPAGR